MKGILLSDTSEDRREAAGAPPKVQDRIARSKMSSQGVIVDRVVDSAAKEDERRWVCVSILVVRTLGVFVRFAEANQTRSVKTS